MLPVRRRPRLATTADGQRRISYVYFIEIDERLSQGQKYTRRSQPARTEHRAPDFKMAVTAATQPSNPSPLSEAGGKGAAVLPLTWMPSRKRGWLRKLPAKLVPGVRTGTGRPPVFH